MRLVQPVGKVLHGANHGATAWRSFAWSVSTDRRLRVVAFLLLAVILAACQQNGAGDGGSGGGGDGY
jgi:hypothetical protein